MAVSGLPLFVLDSSNEVERGESGTGTDPINAGTGDEAGIEPIRA